MPEGQNIGSLAVDGHGILHFPLLPRLAPSSPTFPCRRLYSPPSFSTGRSDDGMLPTPHLSTRPSFPFRRLDLPPSLSPGRFDDGILPTPHFSTRLPPHSCLRRSGSSPLALGSASAGFCHTCILCVAIDTLGASPFLFSPSLFPAAYNFSSAASRPRVSSNFFSPSPLSPLASRITSLSSSPSSSCPVGTVVL